MRVGLVSCSASKLDRPAPAAELYTSDLFRKSWAWSLLHCDLSFILSAKHGLLEGDRRISPYDFAMPQHSPAGRREWATRVVRQLQQRHLLAGVRFFILAGVAYVRPLEPLLEDEEDVTVDTPLGNMQIGQRLAWLKRHGPQRVVA